MRSTLTPAESHRHTAAVCRSEALARRTADPRFAGLLDTWAANQERRADEALASGQPDLFPTILQHG